eukprot:TRINITY_DN15924_c0_g1_i1.p1 TRINITY_DN15924_c0_g1~~TRINITY_DN15924_c0_g1_i1.p1  ORF type:complete len:377 (+),score=44.14 TRINITY_DN15924_c0_g1_i1:56-1186(+)
MERTKNCVCNYLGTILQIQFMFGVLLVTTAVISLSAQQQGDSVSISTSSDTNYFPPGIVPRSAEQPYQGEQRQQEFDFGNLQMDENQYIIGYQQKQTFGSYYNYIDFVVDPTHDFTVYKAVEVQKYKHDSSAFTQGLIYHQGTFYESTGKPQGYDADSLVRQYTVGQDSYNVLLQTPPDTKFGEGLALLHDKLYRLILDEDTLQIYDLELNKIGEGSTGLSTGWGITSDGENLIVSDGSSSLYFYQPDSLQQIKQIQVTFQGNQFSKLNELEWIDGLVWANLLQSDCIVGIDPEDGKIMKIIVVSGFNFRNKLISQYGLSRSQETILNGIAHDKQQNRTYITGKFWPVLYEIEFAEEFNQDTVNGDPFLTVAGYCA